MVSLKLAFAASVWIALASVRDAGDEACITAPDSSLVEKVSQHEQGSEAVKQSIVLGHLGRCEEESKNFPKAAAAFKDLRAFWGVPDDFLARPEAFQASESMAAAGKSKAAFFFTADGNFIVKTATAHDKHSLLGVIEDYAAFMKAYPDSLLPRYLTSCRTVEEASPRRFFVMYNWKRGALPSSARREGQRVFDLKGSAAGRFANASKAVLKDLNFASEAAFVGRNSFLRLFGDGGILPRDIKWLQDRNFMDYSLILSVQELDEANSDDAGAHVCGYTGIAPEACPPRLEVNSQPLTAALMGPFHATCGYLMTTVTLGELPGRPGVRTFAYSFGIIDVLQRWVMKKQIANAWKSLSTDPATLSSVPPPMYADRFLRYLSFSRNGDLATGPVAGRPAFVSLGRFSSPFGPAPLRGHLDEVDPAGRPLDLGDFECPVVLSAASDSVITG